jgi:ribosome maturation factor RimP
MVEKEILPDPAIRPSKDGLCGVITHILEASLEALGYRLVLVKLADVAGRKTLTLMSERKDGQAMGIEDCTTVSRTASALLDVEDPIATAYDLEVCSPGIDRPLTRAEDFARYAGYEAKCETIFPIEGRKRFKGKIKGLEKDDIILTMPEGEAKIPFNTIRTAKLSPPNGGVPFSPKPKRDKKRKKNKKKKR